MMVVLFDGVCNLCNNSVDWIIRHDKLNRFQFSSLQSNYGQSVVSKFNIQGDYMNTVVLVEDDKAFYRSTAALRILKHIGGVYSLGYAFIIVPPFIRNFVYDVVANYRYRWFGKRDTCRVPTPELKSKFLE